MLDAAQPLALHVFIMCWPGHEDSSHHIAAAIEGHADHLTVLYKNDTDRIETGPGDWRKIPSDWFYGSQFRETLDLRRGDIMLHIQADASYSDWPELIQRCREAYSSISPLGFWCPNVYHSWYTPELAQVMKLPDGHLACVGIADGVVWAISSRVADYMRKLDFTHNNLGWGCNMAAAAVAVTQGESVVMDLDLHVVHPEGSGYNREKAGIELEAFLQQLTLAQQSYLYAAYGLMKAREQIHYMQLVKPTRFLQPSYWLSRLRSTLKHASGDLQPGPLGRRA